MDRDKLAIELGAIEKREYRGPDQVFCFYILGPKRHRYYPIYRYLNSSNSAGQWGLTLGNEQWVDQCKRVPFGTDKTFYEELTKLKD